ncbi:SPASM domain-containing protein, partial [Omnitrophica bacterium]|nr:SPASM domain-containing protein [Candidatus Omnitrophota bacterium]
QIRVDGTVIPCCGDVQNRLALGKAQDSTIQDLWHSDQLNRYRELHQQGRWQEIEACRKCGLPYA